MRKGSDWIEAGIALLAKIRDTQSGQIERASEICAEAIGAGGFVHLFGTGHSRIPVEEMFPRYGSYPGFHPLVELSMTFYTPVVAANGQREGPGWTLAAIAVADAIKVRTAEFLLARGKLPPVITSVAEVGRRRSDELFEAAYREHARRAAHSLAT